MARNFKDKDFSKIIRGYAPEEVDEYIGYIDAEYAKVEHVAADYSRKLSLALKKLEEMNNYAQELENKLAAADSRSPETELANARLDEAEKARKAAEEAADSALRRADEIIRKAEEDAEEERESILSDAREEAERIIEAARKETAGAREASAKIRGSAEKMYGEIISFRDKLFEAYNSHIESIENITSGAGSLISGDEEEDPFTAYGEEFSEEAESDDAEVAENSGYDADELHEIAVRMGLYEHEHPAPDPEENFESSAATEEGGDSSAPGSEDGYLPDEPSEIEPADDGLTEDQALDEIDKLLSDETFQDDIEDLLQNQDVESHEEETPEDAAWEQAEESEDKSEEISEDELTRKEPDEEFAESFEDVLSDDESWDEFEDEPSEEVPGGSAEEAFEEISDEADGYTEDLSEDGSDGDYSGQIPEEEQLDVEQTEASDEIDDFFDVSELFGEFAETGPDSENQTEESSGEEKFDVEAADEIFGDAGEEYTEELDREPENKSEDLGANLLESADDAADEGADKADDVRLPASESIEGFEFFDDQEALEEEDELSKLKKYFSADLEGSDSNDDSDRNSTNTTSVALNLDDFFKDDESKDFYDDEISPEDFDGIDDGSAGSDLEEEFDIIFGKMNPAKSVEEIKRQPIIPAEEPKNPKRHSF
ncbi:MAG: DivIVA domain-containing protein [Clostridia bacterium]|nr:DivIVA domain-containing protein [Clostridia bacterium]